MYFLIKWWCSGSMLGSRGVSGVNHKRSAGPKRAVNLQSLGSEHGHCSPRDVWDVGAVSVHVCSDGRPTCTKRIPEVPSRYQAFKRCFFCGFNTRKKKQTWIFQECVLWLYIFFCFGCFCHFGSLMIRTVLENTVKYSVSLLVYSLVVHADACLFACSFFDSKMQICWIQTAADIRPIW